MSFTTGLGRKTAQKESLDRLMGELEQKTLDWLTALAEGQQGLNQNAPHIYAFESSLDRLELKLTDAQKTRLTADCLTCATFATFSKPTAN